MKNKLIQAMLRSLKLCKKTNRRQKENGVKTTILIYAETTIRNHNIKLLTKRVKIYRFYLTHATNATQLLRTFRRNGRSWRKKT